MFSTAEGAARDGMRDELFGYVLQLSVIAVIGGAVTFLYQIIQHGIEDAVRREGLRTAFVTRLGDAFRSAKAARRILRSEGLSRANPSLPGVLSPAQRDAYAEQCRVINAAQLALESLLFEVRCFPEPVNTTALEDALTRMEKYLNGIVKEFEQQNPKATLAYTDLCRLDEFTGGLTQSPGGPKSFKDDFQEAHRTAIETVLGCPVSQPPQSPSAQPASASGATGPAAASAGPSARGLTALGARAGRTPSTMGLRLAALRFGQASLPLSPERKVRVDTCSASAAGH
jgi:hypothetical protein